MFRDARRRGFEQHHASARSEMIGHALHGGAQCLRIENVLQHRDAEHEIELLAGIELRQVLHQEAAAARDAFRVGTTLGFGDHRGAQVHAGDDAAASQPATAPAAHAATHIEHASAGCDVEPGTQREALAPVDHAVVELRHAIRAHGRESRALRGEAPRAIFPVVMRAGSDRAPVRHERS